MEMFLSDAVVNARRQVIFFALSYNKDRSLETALLFNSLMDRLAILLFQKICAIQMAVL